jgi:hypothetical protein
MIQYAAANQLNARLGITMMAGTGSIKSPITVNSSTSVAV